MTIEEEIFKKSAVEFEKLVSFGFKKLSKFYEYQTEFMQGEFKAVIRIDKNGNISGKVYDVENDEEYLPLRIENNKSAYSGIVKANYEEILVNIREKCTKQKYFIHPQSNRIANLIFEKFQVKPDFPWKDYDTYGVFRNTNNRKWFALLMDIEKSKLDKTKVGKTDVINIKLDKEEIQSLIKQNGFYPAYHMNKNNWITIVLDDTLPDDTVMKYISESYGFTKQKKSKQ